MRSTRLHERLGVGEDMIVGRVSWITFCFRRVLLLYLCVYLAVYASRLELYPYSALWSWMVFDVRDKSDRDNYIGVKYRTSFHEGRYASCQAKLADPFLCDSVDK